MQDKGKKFSCQQVKKEKPPRHGRKADRKSGRTKFENVKARILGEGHHLQELMVKAITGIYKTITSVPAPIRIQPSKVFAVNSSCKNTKAKIKVITTLNLSIGTTFDASPICSAL